MDHQFSKTFGNSNRGTKIWAVASGKGGVGKTFISTSLAITLTKLNHSVLIVDFDTTGANVHTNLGMQPANLSLRNWFEEKMPLKEVITKTNLPRLSYIQGIWDSWSSTDLSADIATKFIEEVRPFGYDFVFVDLSPGPSEFSLEILENADEKILVTTPEPTSIEKNYRFIEAFLCHTLKKESRPEAFSSLVKSLQSHRHRKIRQHFSFRQFLKENDGFMVDHFEKLHQKPIRLLVNSCRGESDDQLGYAIKSVANKFYDLRLDFLESIEYDNAVWQSVRTREPVLISQPFTPLAGQFLGVCKHLIAPTEMKAVG